ncbi:hypothetical protein Tco_1357916 [Tanacetum coccineum]
MVAFLSKPEESDGFEHIVDFLNAHPIKYALTVNPIIYTSCIEQFWSTAVAKMVNGEVQLHALLDGKQIIITKANVRRDLQLDAAEGVECLPNATIFEELTRMGKPKRKDTQVPKPGAPADIVVDEVVYKELDDRLVRAATTASSLEAEQDSGSRPRFQETIRDTIAQTRMAKKLEKRNRSRSHKLKRLYKVGLTAMVESFGDEQILGEDDSKEERKINDTDQDITLVGYDEEMFDVGQEANIALIEECDDIQAKMDADYQLAQRLQAKKQEQFTIIEKATLFKELLEQRRKHFAAKRAEEKMNKPPTQA